MLYGVDISNWQGGHINFDALAGAKDFVIMKASESNNYTDAWLNRNQTASRQVGMLRGYYHFANGVAAPETQADFFLKAIGGLQSGEVLVLDYEVHYSNPVDFCKRFLDRVQTLTGTKALLYMSLSVANGYNWQPVIAGDYGLWVAHWDNISGRMDPSLWPVTAFKQYSSEGNVAGIPGPVDLDSFFGDKTAFQKYGYV